MQLLCRLILAFLRKWCSVRGIYPSYRTYTEVWMLTDKIALYRFHSSEKSGNYHKHDKPWGMVLLSGVWVEHLPNREAKVWLPGDWGIYSSNHTHYVKVARNTWAIMFYGEVETLNEVK